MRPSEPVASTNAPGSGPLVVLARGGDDRRAQYMCAKRIAEYWGGKGFQDALAQMRSGENLIVARFEIESQAKELADSLLETGAEAWVVRQQQISGFDVY